MRLLRSRLLSSSAVLLASASTAAFAQGLPVGATSASAALTAYMQFDADIEGGGEARYDGFFATGSVTRRFTPQVTAGFSLRYDYEDWRWSGSNDFGGEPWGRIHRPGLAATFVYAMSDGVTLLAQPTVQWAYESGASSGDALNWGAVFAVSRAFSPDLTLGLGVGLFREIDKNQAFPVVLVNWKINDRLRLANAAPTGPAGGAGLELAWTVDDAWEVAAGAAWRHYRFRLDRDGPVPDGIGERNSFPLLARATWRFSPASRLDFYAGASVAGKLEVHDRDDNELVSRDLDPAPLLGVTFQTRF